jgi:hypothetical protein
MKAGHSYSGAGEVFEIGYASTSYFLQTIYEAKFQEENMCNTYKLLKEEAHQMEAY